MTKPIPKACSTASFTYGSKKVEKMARKLYKAFWGYDPISHTWGPDLSWIAVAQEAIRLGARVRPIRKTNQGE